MIETWKGTDKQVSWVWIDGTAQVVPTEILFLVTSRAGAILAEWSINDPQVSVSETGTITVALESSESIVSTAGISSYSLRATGPAGVRLLSASDLIVRESQVQVIAP